MANIITINKERQAADQHFSNLYSALFISLELISKIAPEEEKPDVIEQIGIIQRAFERIMPIYCKNITNFIIKEIENETHRIQNN